MTVKAFALGLLALVSLSSAQAQRTTAPSTPVRTDTDPRWLPWLGCWQGDSTGNGLVCIVPVANSRSVDRVSIEGTTIVARDRMTADSVSRRFTRDGCRGIETGEWSTSGHLLYLRAEFTCADSLEGRSTTLFAFTSNGEWIESMQLRAARGTLERSTRYRDAGLSSALPKESAATLRAKRLAIATARAAASAPASNEEMSEAARTVGDDVVRPWLVARGYLAENAPQRAPAPGEMTVAPTAQQQMCQTVVCYSPQPYSTYNGTPAPPYPSYVYSSWGSYYGYLPMISSYWVPAPLVVIGGSSRRPVRRDQPRDQPRDQRTIRLHDDPRPPATARPREQPRPSVQRTAMRVVQPRRR
jgi:hypothetical protein